MPPGDGWYLLGPLIAVALVGFLGAIFWRMGLQWDGRREQDPLRDLYPDGLAIFGDPFGDPFRDSEDYGLLLAAAVTEDPDVAEEIRSVLADAGIRATSATRPDGRFLILVFGEVVEEARRLVGDSPAL
jgi:hypothetical protein